LKDEGEEPMIKQSGNNIITLKVK